MAMQVAGHLCWLKNGAWRAPCDDPYLAKAADSHLTFARSGLHRGIFLHLSPSSSLTHNASHTHLAFHGFWLAPFFILRDFSSPLSTHIIIYPCLPC
jgi:hypothetical protein